MIIGDKLRALREQKNITQQEMQKLTGLWPCYISKVENCHTVPTLETLEKFTRALQVPLYQLFYEDVPPRHSDQSKQKAKVDVLWGAAGKDARLLAQFQRLLAKSSEDDRELLLQMANRMARLTRS